MLEEIRASLEETLLEQIPLTGAIGVRVEEASLQKIVIQAPFANNINHKKTVFGGSLHAVATLACWSLLHVNMKALFSERVEIVISSSETAYLSPVTGDFKATCRMPKAQEWDHFVKTVQKKGKGRIYLQAAIFQDDRPAVDYSGAFVAIKRFTD